MPRVTVLGGRLHPAGGVESHVRNFCRWAAGDGVRVRLLASHSPAVPPWLDDLRAAGVSVWSAGPGRAGVIRLLARVAAARRTDVLYTHGQTGLAVVARRLLPRRTVWVHHHHTDDRPETLAAFSRNGLAALARCDQLIVCTQAHEVSLDAQFRRGGRTTFLPYLKDEGQPPASPRPVGDPVVLGFFGLLRVAKGVPFLLESADWFRANGYVCRLHGPDIEGVLPAALPPGVEWAGAYNPAADLDRLMAAVDVVVIPSVGPEGLPLVFAEAVSRGVPVVAFDGGGLRDVAGFHPGVMVLPPDPEGFRAAVRATAARLKADPGLGRSLAETYHQSLGNRITVEWWRQLLARYR